MRLRQHGLAARELDGETVVLDVLGSRYLSINAAGTVLLGELRKGTDEDQMICVLAGTFGIDEETARRDLSAFLADLDELGLLDHGN